MKHHAYHIVAVSGDAFAGQGIIGKDNQLPWPKNSQDMKFFKETTTGATVIMGRKTFESIGRPLPNRTNFVLSRSGWSAEGVTVFNSIQDAIAQAPTEKVFIIGGAKIYEQTIQDVEGIYLTPIKGSYEGDAKYPKIPASFQKDSEKSKTISETYGLPIVYLKNTSS